MEAEAALPGCLLRLGETLGAADRVRADRAMFRSLRAVRATGGEMERAVEKGSATGKTPPGPGHIQCTRGEDSET